MQQLTDFTARLEVERAAHAAGAARLEAAQSQIDDLTNRLRAVEASAREASERARTEIQAAHDRATGAERRAALDIENERAARGRADKRAEAVERRLESLQATSASQVEELIKTKSQLDHERKTVDRLRTANDAASAQRQALDNALVEARVAMGRAEAKAKTTQAAMAQLLPLLAQKQQTKAAPKARHAAKGS